MIKGMFALVILFLLIGFISCTCNESQIDINSANITELDKIINVGPVIAQNIINSRPFNSIDDLINVSRIGNITLNEIKQQGLACVSEERVEEQEAEIIKNATLKEASEKETQEKNITNLLEQEKRAVDDAKTEETEQILNNSIIELSPLNLDSLNSKGIKSENDKEILKRRLSLFGLTTLGLILGVLLLIKLRKKKNEYI